MKHDQPAALLQSRFGLHDIEMLAPRKRNGIPSIGKSSNSSSSSKAAACFC